MYCNETPTKGLIMNQKVAKWTSKIGVAALAALVIGVTYRADKDAQKKIDEKYAGKKNDTESSDA